MSDFIEEAKERAHNFIELPHVRSHFRPYDPDPAYALDRGNALDPLFEWSRKRTPDPCNLMVTQDWGLESIADKDGFKEENGTVKANVAYTEECFKFDPGEDQKTFSGLFHTGWSRSVIESRLYLVLNAVWGLRKFPAFETSSKPSVPDKIHASALNLWLWVATELQPKHIYLCGNWARNSLGEFGPGPDYPLTLSVDEYFAHWRCLKHRQPEIVAKARVILSTTKFHSLPHPSYGEWKWPGYAERVWW